MTYCFRLRCKLGDWERIDSDDRSWTLTSDADDENVLLFSNAEHLRDAKAVIIQGWEYDSEGAALEAGRRWRARVTTAFARMWLGGDFGDRTPDSGRTPYGLQMLSEQNDGVPVRNDVRGVAVFEWNPDIRFVPTEPVNGTVHRAGPAVLRALREAAIRDLVLTPEQELAFDLYSASGNLLNADARFVMLMMAVETLIPQTHRSAEALGHVEYLIQETDEASELTDADRSSLVDSLEWLSYESIRKAGRTLAETLGERSYMVNLPDRWPEDPVTFFMASYDMRSQLVHGRYPRPDRGEVDQRASELEQFVADLLARDLLDFDPRAEPDPEA
jgi:hypothetical protein